MSPVIGRTGRIGHRSESSGATRRRRGAPGDPVEGIVVVEVGAELLVRTDRSPCHRERSGVGGGHQVRHEVRDAAAVRRSRPVGDRRTSASSTRARSGRSARGSRRRVVQASFPGRRAGRCTRRPCPSTADAVVEHDAGDLGRPELRDAGVPEQPVDASAGRQASTEPVGGERAAQHPFERRASGHEVAETITEQSEVAVALDLDADLLQRGEHVRVAVPEHEDEASEEHVERVCLRSSGAIDGERSLGIRARPGSGRARRRSRRGPPRRAASAVARPAMLPPTTTKCSRSGTSLPVHPSVSRG